MSDTKPFYKVTYSVQNQDGGEDCEYFVFEGEHREIILAKLFAHIDTLRKSSLLAEILCHLSEWGELCESEEGTAIWRAEKQFLDAAAELVALWECHDRKFNQ